MSRRQAVRVGTWGMLVGLVLAASGCGDGDSGVVGKWEGSMVERGRTFRLGLTIAADRSGGGLPGGSLTGKLTLLDKPAGGDVRKGQSFDLADVRLDGDRLTFVVLLLPDKDNRDNLSFDLRLTGGKLVGTGRENRSSAKPLDITFERAP